VLRQIRYALDGFLLDSLNLKIGWRGRQRAKIRSLLRKGSKNQQHVLTLILNQIHDWVANGYPFTNPQLRNYSLDFSASTENSTGQGYWFTLDKKREHEILLHLKLPPGIEGKCRKTSPYKSKTLTFRFFDWFSRSFEKDRKKAIIAKKSGDIHRAEQLFFRAAKFEDMHQQLLNTIEFQHISHKLSRLKQKKNHNTEDIVKLEKKKGQLKDSRRSAPPRILMKGTRVILQIPFLSPNGEVSSQILGRKKYHTLAGVDRGLRAPVALSVEKQDTFEDLLITVGHLVLKREYLKKYAYKRTSNVTRKKNNWDKKRSGQCYPAPILKQDRYISALWRKIRRLDREIARQVASQTVWFCEEHLVKKVFFEDLRSFQAHAGSKDLSWSLSTNLWGMIIDTARYMRESLGHSPYSVWTVNPRYTSQTCHRCGERGIRVEDEISITEKRGGKYFYCAKCNTHFHADINAARNIIHVQDNKSSAVPGRAKGICPTLSKLQ
jgi:transposase